MSLRAACVFAAVAGFVSLSCEILWFRVYSYLTGGSPVTFGLLLGIYLAGLAVGADLAGRICARAAIFSDRGKRSALAMSVLAADTIGYLVVPSISFSASSPSRGWIALLAVMVSAGLFGALLPLVSHFGIPADSRSGERLSYIYAANIGGCVIGSLFTGFVLMQLLTTQQTATVIALTGLSLVVPMIWAGRQSEFLALVIPAVFALAFVVAAPRLFDRLYERLQFKDAFNGQRFAHVVENRHGVIAVTDSGATFGGGVYDGNISTNLIDNPNGIERAYALSALHPRPRHVLMIGLSTGAWAQVVASSPFVDSLTIVEINPGYLDLIRGYSLVAPLLRNPKIKIMIDDGRRWLVRNPDRRFDVILSNTTFHYRSNSTNLLSIEFMRLVHRHLNPGGMFYFNTTGSQDAMKTAFTEFPHGLRLLNFIAVSDSAISMDEDRWRSTLASYRSDNAALFEHLDARKKEKFDRLASLPQTLHSAPLSRGLESRESVLARIPSADVVTDDNMLPEWRTLILKSDTTSR